MSEGDQRSSLLGIVYRWSLGDDIVLSPSRITNTTTTMGMRLRFFSNLFLLARKKRREGRNGCVWWSGLTWDVGSSFGTRDASALSPIEMRKRFLRLPFPTSPLPQSGDETRRSEGFFLYMRRETETKISVTRKKIEKKLQL